MSKDEHAVHSAKLYDAVGQIWLELFGEHVHVGAYCASVSAERQRPLVKILVSAHSTCRVITYQHCLGSMLAGYYPAGWPESKRTKSWQQAQLDHVDAIVDFAGIKKAGKVTHSMIVSMQEPSANRQGFERLVCCRQSMGPGSLLAPTNTLHST